MRPPPGPFGVNVPLAYRYAPQLMDVITEEARPRPSSPRRGNPATWTARLHDAGCRVAHVVSSSKFALKSREAVDAVVAEGFEAGGHNGREETTTMALVPQVRQAVATCRSSPREASPRGPACWPLSPWAPKDAS